MCTCDRGFGERFLPYQLAHGTDLHSGLRVDVTLGFVPNVCNECRGLRPEPSPKAEIHGRTSKIVRYYWRELYFATTQRFADWLEQEGGKAAVPRPQQVAKRKEIEMEVLTELKDLHARTPKYTYGETPASQVLSECSVPIVNLSASYVNAPDGTRTLSNGLGTFGTVEGLVAAHYRQEGYDVIECESRPFHALFGIYMYLLIEDPADKLQRFIGFGRRSPPVGDEAPQIWMNLPRDFGRPGYATRRADAIEEHLGMLEGQTDWLFDYWLEPSCDLRQYLWAHTPHDVDRARRLAKVLGDKTLITILRYLVSSYWAHYTGWPDLFAFKGDSYLFAEVKGSGDTLSEDQKRWVRGNATTIGLPFTLVRVHRVGSRSGPLSK